MKISSKHFFKESLCEVTSILHVDSCNLGSNLSISLQYIKNKLFFI